MAPQVSFRWYWLNHLLRHLGLTTDRRASSRTRFSSRLSKTSRGRSRQQGDLAPVGKMPSWNGATIWLLIALGSSVLLLWNWKLMLSTGVGSTSMLLLYAMQQPNWQHRWRQFQKSLPSLSLSRTARQLTLAVGGGATAVLTTYMALAIWADAESPWLASGALLQGAATLVVLILLLRQFIEQQSQQRQGRFQQHLQDLSDGDPLKRLLAVQLLTRALAANRLDAEQQAALFDCFRLMIGRESEIIVQEAVMDGLHTLEQTRQAEAILAPAPAPEDGIKRLARSRRR